MLPFLGTFDTESSLPRESSSKVPPLPLNRPPPSLHSHLLLPEGPLPWDPPLKGPPETAYFNGTLSSVREGMGEVVTVHSSVPAGHRNDVLDTHRLSYQPVKSSDRRGGGGEGNGYSCLVEEDGRDPRVYLTCLDQSPRVCPQRTNNDGTWEWWRGTRL